MKQGMSTLSKSRVLQNDLCEHDVYAKLSDLVREHRAFACVEKQASVCPAQGERIGQ